MKDIVSFLFNEHASTAQIEPFNLWHFVYLFGILGTALVLSILYKDKSAEKKEKLIRLFAYLTIGIYIADFFIMPLSDSYGSISEDKLPFHICTLMGVMAAFVQFNRHFKAIKTPVVTLAITSTIMWMCYPGSALGGEPPFCYRIFQTFIFHGLLFCWGVLNLSLGSVKLDFRKIWQEFIGIMIIFVWASFGNSVYDGHNWFFINGVLFPAIPEEYMPPLVVITVFAVCVAIYGIYFGLKALLSRKAKQLA